MRTLYGIHDIVGLLKGQVSHDQVIFVLHSGDDVHPHSTEFWVADKSTVLEECSAFLDDYQSM